MCSNTFAQLVKACKLTKFVCIGHSKQMYNRLVQEAGKELQREESYKEKDANFAQALRKAH